MTSPLRRILLFALDELHGYYLREAWCPNGHGNIDRMKDAVHVTVGDGSVREVLCPRCPHE